MMATTEDAPDGNLRSKIYRALAAFFPEHSGPYTGEARQFQESDIQEISNLLRLVKRDSWSRVPRTYIVLRTIGQLHRLDDFVEEGVSDMWFPYSMRGMPDILGPSAKTEFLEAQTIVLTKAIDLERGEQGKHRHFDQGEVLPFESKGTLGSGGTCEVDKVLSLISRREYARKRIRRVGQFSKAKGSMQTYTSELEILKRMKHHHIVKLVGSYTDSRFLGLIMSPVAEYNLSQFFSLSKTTDYKTLLRTFFGCLANALKYLHDSDIRHKDIKPQNILVNRRTVLLTDFGLSRDSSNLSRCTTEGSTGLTPRYCAPEVADYEPRNTSSDIWSLGCVFLEMVTVLQNRSVEEMKTFFESKGSGSQLLHKNEEAIIEWMITLREDRASDHNNLPLDWIQSMLVWDRHNRVKASALVDRIATCGANTLSRPAFCGVCCVDDEVPWENEGGEREVTTTSQGLSHSSSHTDESILTHALHHAQMPLPLDHFEGKTVQYIPSVPLRVPPSVPIDIKDANEHMQIIEMETLRKPSEKRISPRPSTPVERLFYENGDDKSAEVEMPSQANNTKNVTARLSPFINSSPLARSLEETPGLERPTDSVEARDLVGWWSEFSRRRPDLSGLPTSRDPPKFPSEPAEKAALFAGSRDSHVHESKEQDQAKAGALQKTPEAENPHTMEPYADLPAGPGISYEDVSTTDTLNNSTVSGSLTTLRIWEKSSEATLRRLQQLSNRTTGPHLLGELNMAKHKRNRHRSRMESFYFLLTDRALFYLNTSMKSPKCIMVVERRILRTDGKFTSYEFGLLPVTKIDKGSFFFKLQQVDILNDSFPTYHFAVDDVEYGQKWLQALIDVSSGSRLGPSTSTQDGQETNSIQQQQQVL